MGSQEAGSGDRESLDDVLTRLRLPKRAEKIWYDYAQERTWYECKVVKVRFKEDGNGDERTADDVEYLLKCTDDSVVNLDEWLALDADGSHWKRHKEEIGHGHKKHERWALEEKTKIQKVVQELLREKRGAWITAKGIEDLLKEAAESGTTTYCGLSGDALRHCLGAVPLFNSHHIVEAEINAMVCLEIIRVVGRQNGVGMHVGQHIGRKQSL